MLHRKTCRMLKKNANSTSESMARPYQSSGAP
jgi:hypothetical protein